jgi:hypothetical protein
LVAADSILFAPTDAAAVQALASVNRLRPRPDRPLRRYLTGMAGFAVVICGEASRDRGLLRLWRLAGDQLDMILLSPADYLV